MIFDATFWLLVSFLIFLALVFKKAKSLISSSILKYKETISTLIETAEKQRINSAIELENAIKKTSEIEEICKKLKHNATLEAERIESEMKNEISSYLTFKEKNIEEKTKIFLNSATNHLKSEIINQAINLALKYFQTQKSTNKFDFNQISATLLKTK